MSDGTCDAHAPPAQVLGTVTADCNEVATVLFGVLRSYCIINFNIRVRMHIIRPCFDAALISAFIYFKK